MTIRLLVLSAMLLAPVAVQASSVMQGVSDKGYVLTDGRGMSLYTFDKDEAGKIACVDACAQNWPPLLADKGAKAMGEYSLVKRPDGAMQWAYRGKPLYLWSKDTKPGETSGDNFKEVWHLARP